MMLKTARIQPAAAIQASANVRFFDGLANRAIQKKASAAARRAHEAGGSVNDIVGAYSAICDRFDRARKNLFLKIDDALWAPVRARWVDDEPYSVATGPDRDLYDPIYSDA